MWAGERVMNWLISAAPVFIPANVGQRTCIAHQNWACKSVICRRVSSYAFWIGSRCWQVMNRHSKTLAILDFVACVADMMFKRSKANLRYIYNSYGFFFEVPQVLEISCHNVRVSGSLFRFGWFWAWCAWACAEGNRVWGERKIELAQWTLSLQVAAWTASNLQHYI